MHGPASGPPRQWAAEILGRHPAFLTPGQARELALTPGTTLSRLLIDPADGRLIERSITTYRPDAAMRRQIIAADLTSRSPGSRTPATSCEIDHETPWTHPGDGTTTETNLDLKDIARHQLKTAAWWHSALAPNRDVRWETLLGQTETTRCHDYRQYLRRAVTTEHLAPDSLSIPDSAADGPDHAAGHHDHTPDPVTYPDPDDELDLACRALYAALAHRDPGTALLDHDDEHGATEHHPRLHGWITLTHRSTTGQRQHGPPEHHASVARLLGFPTPDHPAATAGPDTEAPINPDATTDTTPSHSQGTTQPDQRPTPPWQNRTDDTPPF